MSGFDIRLEHLVNATPDAAFKHWVDAEARRDGLLADWRLLWQASRIEPETPREMQAFLRRHADLVRRGRGVDELRAKAESLADRCGESAALLRLRLSQKIGEDGVKFLIEPSGDSKDSTLSMVMAAVKDIDLDRIFHGTDNEVTRKREASNEWVLSGAHAVSGRPLLANDPHLGLTFPGVWYLARLIGPGFDIRGATSPGSPAVVLGHNGTVGWGFTTTNLDSQDVFVERVDPTDPNRYITPDGARPFVVREETIKVAWGDPVTMRVRETRHGPVIDDFVRRGENLTPQGHVLALQATALDGADTSAEGFARVGSAQNWDEFLSAVRRIVSPMQNMVFADTSGNVGLISPARVPIRRKGDGSMPVPGWTSEYDWAGFVPFDEPPRVYNPVGGVIVNANGRLVPSDYRHFISRDWAEPYR